MLAELPGVLINIVLRNDFCSTAISLGRLITFVYKNEILQMKGRDVKTKDSFHSFTGDWFQTYNPNQIFKHISKAKYKRGDR